MAERIVSIFGTARTSPGEPVFELAFEAGRVLARTGFTVANGGYGGTMLASAKGAAEAGGQVIGVTCSAFGRAEANPYVTRNIVTRSLDERLDTLIKLGSAYVVLPGGTGTLLELAKVWELKNKGFLNRDKPVILLGGYWKPLVALISTDDADSTRCLQQVEQPERIPEILGTRT